MPGTSNNSKQAGKRGQGLVASSCACVPCLQARAQVGRVSRPVPQEAHEDPPVPNQEQKRDQRRINREYLKGRPTRPRTHACVHRSLDTQKTRKPQNDRQRQTVPASNEKEKKTPCSVHCGLFADAFFGFASFFPNTYSQCRRQNKQSMSSNHHHHTQHKRQS